jgi:tyrosyl-tRNA synthetase
MNTNFIEELRWRGMLHDVTPGAEELLTKQMVKGYIGFDPTADSLGVGNLVQIMTLLHFQQAGHKPIALVGGATGMVGDPSGKSQERNLLDENTLQHNLSSQRKQLEKFLDFNCGDNSAEIVNNYDWFKNIPFLEFIRDTGKYITVNYMLSKDSVKRRIDGTDGAEGMSFTEFTYQLIQGYDYYYLWKNHGIQLQMGGSDQWGNITTGTELIRKKDGGEDAFALTTPLIRKADGSKFGKTEKGNLWLNAGDDDVKNYIRIFTLKTREEIEALEAEHAQDPGRRVLQKALAEDITRRVHSEEALQMAIDASGILFGKGTIDTLRKLNDDDFAGVFADVPQKEMEAAAIENGINIIDLIAAQTGYFASNGEARRAMQGNGFSLNKEKISDPARTVTKDDLLNNRYLLLSKSKKDYLLVRVV